MTLTEFICTEGIGNGLGFHDIMMISGYSISDMILSRTHCIYFNCVLII